MKIGGVMAVMVLQAYQMLDHHSNIPVKPCPTILAGFGSKKTFIMKNLFLAIALLLSSIAFSQTVKVGKDGNFYSAHAAKVKDTGQATGKTFTDSKGNIYPVMQSSSGRYFVIRKSAKTGKEYKQYFTI